MQVRIVTAAEDLLSLEQEWNALAADSPFRSWDWLATWWKHYGEHAGEESSTAGTKLHVLAVYQEMGNREEKAGSREQGARSKGSLIAIAPWYLERSLVSGMVLRWLGDGEVCTDHSSLICPPEHLNEVCIAIADALTSSIDDWDRIDLDAVDEDDAAIECLLAKLQERGCGVTRQPAVSTWAVDLPPTWDDYLAANSKSHRKQLRQLERRVLETDRTVWHRVQSTADFEEGWNVLIDLHQRRRKSLGEPGCFASPAFTAFHREVAGRMLEQGRLRLSWLALDGTPAAAEYHFVGGGATYAYQGGVDPDRLAEEPGRLSTILWLRAAIEEGNHHVDFLRGDEAYKAHWRATPRSTFDVRVTPERRLARLRSGAVSAAESVTDWIKNKCVVRG